MMLYAIATAAASSVTLSVTLLVTLSATLSAAGPQQPSSPPTQPRTSSAPAPTAAQHDHAAADSARPVTLLEGLGTGVHHPITTASPQAQKFFDQGLTLIYAFNHEEAIRSFRKAAELDPASPMPHWGIAYALGPNINLDVDPEREKAAHEAAQRALKLAGSSPASERAYVTAVAKRYSDNPQADLKALAVQYKDAMRAVVQAHPDDLDAATLYAESLMDLHPWQLWAKDGAPTEGTLEIVSVLESVLQRNANHVGANHYYIHAVEASLAPDRALSSAKKLETLVPAAGHLVHMPAHTYMRTGDYAGAVTANARGAEVDRQYIAATNAGGFYPTMYYNHNLDFLASAAMMTGQYAEATKAATEVTANVLPMLAQMPMLEPFGAKQLFVLLRFSKWDEVLKLPAPAPSAGILTTVHHFARGVAHAAQGRAVEAERERDAYRAAQRAIPADAAWGYNTAKAFLAVADAVLEARIAAAKGNEDASIEHWRAAVAAEDALSYNEPADWYYPTRESLGGALVRAKRFVDAERVFREDLERNPNNPRSLFGLWRTLAANDPEEPMTLVLGRRFADAWQHADVPLTLEDF
jgi:tetratricopeptide (TPR) repeat protein